MKVERQPLTTGKGSIGDYTFYQKKKEVIARTRRNEISEKQPDSIRIQSIPLANINNLWHRFPRDWKPVFNVGDEGMSNYNGFVSHARYTLPVYLTRHEAQYGDSVLVPVAVSGGLLPPIGVHREGNRFVTDIAVGDGAVGPATGAGDLAERILSRNWAFKKDDLLLIYFARQVVKASVGPRVFIAADVVSLDVYDRRCLAEVVGGFSGLHVCGGCLASGNIYEGGVAWVHLRRRRNGELLRSNQTLQVVNPLMDQYCSTQQRVESLKSYEKKRD